MRPRHYTAENHAGKVITAVIQRRFNEAAALHRGKPDSAAGIVQGVEKLQ